MEYRKLHELRELVILVKGGGELGSAVVHKLVSSHFKVCVTELSNPLAIRREVAFSEAVYEGQKEVEGVTAKLISYPGDIDRVWQEDKVPLLIDPTADVNFFLKPNILIDAVMSKKNLGTRISDASLVIGLGPGFQAGSDVHLVIETNRGHNLGRIIYYGQAEPDTGIPGEIAGISTERVVRAPKSGRFSSNKQIGDQVRSGEVIAFVDDFPIKAGIEGIIRGLLRRGTDVREGMKVGDIDHRGIKDYCYLISDKSRAIAGGVLEAIIQKFNG
jgi:xanthine dehydrogenase accessory factor